MIETIRGTSSCGSIFEMFVASGVLLGLCDCDEYSIPQSADFNNGAAYSIK